MFYRCDSCGCYLDPGEGRICEDCRTAARIRAEKAERMRAAFWLDGDQYSMRTEEMKHEFV